MAITVKVAGVDRTSATLLDTLTVKSIGYAGTGTATLKLLAPGADPQPEDALEILDGATTVFKGKVRNRRRQLSGRRPTPQKVFTLDAQDQTSLLTDDVIDTGGLRSTSETDKARVEWILTTFGTKGVVGGSTVQQVLSGNMPEAQDFTGMNVYEAIEEIAKVSGARFYVDYAATPACHYFATETAAAPFNLSDSPNGVTTFGYEQFELPDDTIELVNAVYVIGSDATTPVWRPDPGTWPTSSHTTYGRREGTIRDGSLSSQAALEAAGDAYISVRDSPRGPISLICFKAGLRAGMVIDLTNATYGLSAVNFPITQVEFSLLPGTAVFGYRVTLADAPTDLIGYMADVDRRVSSAVGVGEDAAAAAPDAVAPVAPTGLVLTTATKQAPDGALYPILQADWNDNAESDLDAYELQLDRAVEGEVTFAVSASGSGGALAAGDYSVIVTGLGPIQGETIRSAVRSQIVASGQRLFVNITAKSGITTYKIYASRDLDPKTSGQTTTTTGSNVEVTPEGSGAVAPSSSTALTFLAPAVFRTRLSILLDEAVQGGVFYGGRVRAVDKSGNYSGYSTVSTITASADTSAPAIPAGLSATAGFRRLGLVWLRNLEPDLDHYEVRLAPETTPGSLLPDTTAWIPRETRSTIHNASDLLIAIRYFAQVRAVDRSGNVRTSVEIATAVNAAANPEAGWSNTGTAKTGGGSTTLAAATSAGATNIKVASVTNFAVGDPIKIGTAPEYRTALTVGTAGAGGTGINVDALTVAHGSGEAVVEVVDSAISAVVLAVGQADIAAGSIVASHINASGIEADKITSGTLTIGGAIGIVDLLKVITAGQDVVFEVNELGVIAYDPANPNRRMRWLNGTLAFSDDGGVTWPTAITPDGIDATAITFGSEPGGSNAVPNAGFEITAFSTALSKLWDVTTDWDDATSQVNLSVGGASLNLTDVTY